MDRDQILGGIPDGDVLSRLPATKRKAIAEALIESILAALIEEQRGPDAWESEHIAAAIGATASGMFNLSMVFAEKALAFPGERALDYVGSTDKRPSIASLREALYAAAALGMRSV